MATVAQSPPAPPVRRGKCRLVLEINGTAYSVRKARAASRHVKIWHLTRPGPDGPVTYGISKADGNIACTCPDAVMRKARCKHQRALVAAGLLCGRSPRRPKGGA
jgi:hypothetical protein